MAQVLVHFSNVLLWLVTWQLTESDGLCLLQASRDASSLLIEAAHAQSILLEYTIFFGALVTGFEGYFNLNSKKYKYHITLLKTSLIMQTCCIYIAYSLT